MRPALLLLAAALSGAACGETVTLKLSYAEPEVRSVTQQVKVHLFADDPLLGGCLGLDPHGKPAGDAPTRLGRPSDRTLEGSPSELPLEVDGLARGRYVVALEGWSARCDSVDRTADGHFNCTRLTNEAPTVLRGYDCRLVDLGEAPTLEANLVGLTPIGSTMRVPLDFPVKAKRYDEGAPLVVVDGEVGLDDFVVQLLDPDASEIDEVPVHFGVVEGSGALVQPAPVLTGPDLASQDNGIARARVRAGLDASRRGPMIIEAHAAGFEGSPIRFHAQPLPGVRVESTFVEMPSDLYLGSTPYAQATMVAGDLDGDGLIDLLTSAGEADHRLVIGYGQADRGFVVASTPSRAKGVRSLTLARLRPGRQTVVAGVAEPRGRYDSTRRTYVVEGPALELWEELDHAPAGPVLVDAPRVVDQLEVGASVEPMSKMSYALDAADLDGDGLDELVSTRCSYNQAFDGLDSAVRCYGGVNDRPDSEVVVLGTATSPDRLVERVVRPTDVNDGGLREAHFGDINGDGSLDLAFVSASELKGVCGNRFAAPTFDLDRNDRFETSLIFGNGYSFAFGTFDDREGEDVVAAGPFRASSAVSGLVVLPGNGCSFDQGPGAVLAGQRTFNEHLLIRAADLNGDGYSEALLLQRDEARLRLYFGGGRGQLAAGPSLPVPSGLIGGLAVGVEDRGGRPEVVVAIGLLDENRIWVLRFQPGP